VKWKGCTGIKGTALLRARLLDACTRLAGTLRTPRATPRKRPFTAVPSRCGDGLADAGRGEACDGTAAGACTEGCTADCTCAPPAGIVLLNAGNTLVRIRAAASQEIVDVALVTGLDAGARLVGIDVRPSTGELFAVGISGSGTTAVAHLYAVERATGVATKIGATDASLTAGGRWGLDFNPTVDRIRLVNDVSENARLNPNNGARADGVGDIDLNPPSGEVIAVAYDRNVTGGGPTGTTLYAIRRTTSELVTVGGVNQTPSPNTGALMAVGALGVVLSATADAGFDVHGTPGTAYAALTSGTEQTSLYTIDLGTAAATPLGPIGDGATPFLGLAVLPAGP
jgi:hypothetical protein